MRHKWIHDNCLHIFDLGTTKWTPLATGLLPLLQAHVAHQVSTWFKAYIFIILSANLAKLKSGAHLTVQLVLFLSDGDVFIRWSDQMVANIRVGWFAVWEEVTKENKKRLKSVYKHSGLLTLSLPEASIKSIIVVLTFKSADETLVCDHSNESY